MFVYVKQPRKLTFRHFTSAKRASSFIKSIPEKFHSIRHAHGMIFVNYYVR